MPVLVPRTIERDAGCVDVLLDQNGSAACYRTHSNVGKSHSSMVHIAQECCNCDDSSLCGMGQIEHTPPRRSSPKFARVIMSATRTNCELLSRLDKRFCFRACATLHTPFLGFFSFARDEFLPILYRQDANSYFDAKYDKRCGFEQRSACIGVT